MKVVETHVETQDLASLQSTHQFASPDFHIKKNGFITMLSSNKSDSISFHWLCVLLLLTLLLIGAGNWCLKTDQYPLGTVAFALVQSALIILLLLNIRSRRRAESVLIKSEADFHAIFEGISDAIVFVDPERHICRVNPAFLTMFGYTVSEVVGRTTEFLYADPDDYADQGRRRFHRGSESEAGVYEMRYRHKDGNEFWAESSGTRIVDKSGTVYGMVAVHRDITRRKQSEESLQQRDETYRSLFENMLNSVVHAKLIFEEERAVDLEYILTNPAFATVTGITEPVNGRRISQVIPGYCENNPESLEVFGRVAFTGVPTHWEHYLGDLDRWFSFMIYSPARGEVIIVSENITDRKRAEIALRESEERFRRLFRDAPMPLCYVNRDGVVVDFNNRFEQLFGYGDADVPTLTQWLQLAYPDPDYRTWVVERWNASVAKSAATGDDIEPLEYSITCKSGRVLNMIVSGIMLGNDLLATFFDLTEQRQAEKERFGLEAQLHQAQKMESVGRLAGGVAHDFNNMLGIIIGYTEMAMTQVDRALPLYSDLEEIFKAGRRSADLTRQLLAFARRQTIAPKVLDLNETVSSMLRMLERLIGEDIDLAWLPGDNLWQVNMDPSQIDQILANLCVNARDAISGVGKVTIETENRIFNEEYCAAHPGFVPGEYVMLTLSDNGCGMDRKTQEQIFEPFFTTKEMGKGTGLGLATVYGIVKQNSGFINIYSEPEQGTVFAIYLPRHSDSSEKVELESERENALRGNETILLVEDEQSILKMTTMMLEMQGYTVLAASTPDEAIRKAESYRGRIDLVMTDVVMPEMNGRDLVRTLLSLYPEIKTLFMSGYTANVIAHHGVLDPGVNFIQKPFSIRQSAVKVREVLDSRAVVS